MARSEIRRDILTGKWVIFATGEGFTSRDYLLRLRGGLAPEPCPLDEGHEHMTPNEIYALRPEDTDPDKPGWQVRVIPDKLPILEPGASEPRDLNPTHELHPPRGHHEIIALTPKHDVSLGELEVPEIAAGLRVLRDRFRTLVAREEVDHVLAMVNHGRESGASLNHAHAQLFALPFVPEDLDDELYRSQAHLTQHGSCLMCREVGFEISSGSRIVAESENMIAYLPFASRLPFQITVTTKSHSARFENTEDSHLDELASVLRQALSGLFNELDDPPYNLVLRSSPVKPASDLYFHWYIDVLTRQLFAANFELVSDVWVNSVTPETAARILRGEDPLEGDN